MRYSKNFSQKSIRGGGSFKISISHKAFTKTMNHYKIVNRKNSGLCYILIDMYSGVHSKMDGLVERKGRGEGKTLRLDESYIGECHTTQCQRNNAIKSNYHSLRINYTTECPIKIYSTPIHCYILSVHVYSEQYTSRPHSINNTDISHKIIDCTQIWQPPFPRHR